ncbi:M23 family metallopeptidase [Curtobacterium sp. MCBA15_001]|uniref:M23 family metallopeptidase n=1 Tax=Curtobacterium sp. MCBA15_001 TaxID=1898731 RepID=UPI0008DD13A7|nr:M23 family metallopeptidase [Curtobacterium sp. MCBA15_001]OIH97672.1 hypothetical protein BIU90_13955 [Curtobacterium sp. MCBA15_001]
MLQPRVGLQHGVVPQHRVVLQHRAVTSLTLPTRTAVMPLGVVALVTCFLVAASTPAQAAAEATGVAVSVRASDPTAGGASQAFTAPVGSAVDVVRDGFAVGSAGVPGVPMGSDAVRPVDGSVPTAGGFGSRWVRGCGACSTNHQGLDFAAVSGSPAVAAMPGRVVAAGVLGGYGDQVLVQHTSGVQTRYGHLSAIDVRVGQVVAAGERVGAVGSTGVSTGPHLHFEVIVDGRPVDPADWLRARGLL